MIKFYLFFSKRYCRLLHGIMNYLCYLILPTLVAYIARSGSNSCFILQRKKTKPKRCQKAYSMELANQTAGSQKLRMSPFQVAIWSLVSPLTLAICSRTPNSPPILAVWVLHACFSRIKTASS